MAKKVSIITLLVFALSGLTYFWIIMRPTLPYTGVWNYDQPNLISGVNIAHLSGGGYSSGIPQIGQVTFSRMLDGEVLGHTDQGCTWRFKADGSGLHLASSTQYCFNRVANLAYNIYQWDVRVDGEHEQETLRATSYLPTGTYDFTLARGRRTEAIDSDDPSAIARQFTGSWIYQPASLSTQFNIVTTVHFSSSAPPDVTQQSMTGKVTYVVGSKKSTVVTTPEGCKLTLEATGNTAELMPAKQTCHTIKGERSYDFWTVASDGNQQTMMAMGTDEAHNNFLLIIGNLIKQ